MKTAQVKGTGVIKIGTDALGARNNPTDPAVMRRVAVDIARLNSAGFKVVLITSGAVGWGRFIVHEEEMSGYDLITKKQVWAAHGNPLLMEAWGRAFKEVGLRCGQILLSTQNLKQKQTRQDLQNLMNAHLALDASIPTINNNDSADATELRSSDNDKTTYNVISFIDLPKPVTVFFLTMVNGVYSEDPRKNPKAVHYDILTRDIAARINMNGSNDGGTGGMDSKTSVAFALSDKGVASYILSAEEDNVVSRVMLDGERLGTAIIPAKPARNDDWHWRQSLLKPLTSFFRLSQ